MKSIKQTLRMWALAAATALLGGQVQAAPTVTFDPASQDISIGQQTSVNIVVSGLTQPADALGGFSLLLNFNNTFLKGLTYEVDPGAKMGAYDANNDFSGTFSGGSLDLFYIANAMEDQDSLAALQGDGRVPQSELGQRAHLSTAAVNRRQMASPIPCPPPVTMAT